MALWPPQAAYSNGPALPGSFPFPFSFFFAACASFYIYHVISILSAVGGKDKENPVFFLERLCYNRGDWFPTQSNGRRECRPGAMRLTPGERDLRPCAGRACCGTPEGVLNQKMEVILSCEKNGAPRI